ncbi:AzlC family ABC transporter permease [Rhizobium sp. SSA_523]|uniref:AzlC family ABC transporter permease n=1 Tax=Rhizobium sp. SSA_523 TaxID=2952477 RepID=UPI0020918E9C|nr:AzlC family ABC transporter permease [Rhizobium sp. SSA_523]MCO5730274.1 AzlC family ABC transporter permease [Rhizobium sp. SSA_523]WKC25329.1 AzlC family ABC transporter permease [Rhizobium sp. SSA_523]
MPDSIFWKGARTGFVIALSTSPFGLLFGAVAVDGGMTPLEATVMSIVLFAGASQLVGVQMFGSDVPAWLIILSVFAVNFRHILYSAALAPYIRDFSPAARAIGLFFLTDPQFAESAKRAELTGRLETRYYMGLAMVIYTVWVVGSGLGALFGKLIGDPAALGMDVLLPVYFLGLVFGFRKRLLFLPVVAVSACASVLAMHTVGSPWHVSLGALAGILTAIIVHKDPAEAPAEAMPGAVAMPVQPGKDRA